ncbi:MAG: SOS response-associated peptidase family protein [Pontixanthobacter sp.]
MLYRLDAAAAAIADNFGLGRSNDPWAGGYVAPAGFAPVITAGREFITGPRPNNPNNAPTRPRMIPRVWGVPPPPNVPYDGHNAVLSVRNSDSPFWIGNLRNSEFRCLIPATAFMEWGSGTDAEGRRIQHWFAASDQPIFAFAGVWKDSEVPSFALLTCEANALLRGLRHERMPVILPPDADAYQTWLYADWARAKLLIQPYSSSLMRLIEPGPIAETSRQSSAPRPT